MTTYAERRDAQRLAVHHTATGHSIHNGIAGAIVPGCGFCECGCGHPIHPGRACDGTGATLDPMYGIDPDEPCACTVSEPLED